MGRSCEVTRQGACRAAMPRIASGAQRGRWARKTALRVVFPVPSMRRARLTMRKHRPRAPSCRGNGKHDPMGTIRLIRTTSRLLLFLAPRCQEGSMRLVVSTLFGILLLISAPPALAQGTGDLSACLAIGEDEG